MKGDLGHAKKDTSIKLEAGDKNDASRKRGERRMLRVGVVGVWVLTLVAVLGTAGLNVLVPTDSSAAAISGNPSDILQLRDVEVTFHKATDTHDVDLMMSLFSYAAVLTDTIRGKIYRGRDDIRTFFGKVAGSMQPQNNWHAYSPIAKTRVDVAGNGSQATLHFESAYIDVSSRQIRIHTLYDAVLARFGGRWLIKELKISTTPEI